MIAGKNLAMLPFHHHSPLSNGFQQVLQLPEQQVSNFIDKVTC